MSLAEAPGRVCESYEHHGYLVEKHRIGLENRTKWVDRITPLYVDIFHRESRISRKIVEANLNHGELNNGETTVLIPKVLTDPEGKPIGFAILSKMVLRERRILYVSRAVLPDYEARGMGEFFITKGIDMQPDDEAIDMVVLKTQSPASVWSMKKSERIGNVYPFDKTYDTNRVVQDVLLETYSRVRRYPTALNIRTGLSEAELKEEGMNLAYHPHYNHKPTMKIFDKMVYEFGMNILRGDTVYVVGEVKKSNGNGSAVLPEVA